MKRFLLISIALFFLLSSVAFAGNGVYFNEKGFVISEEYYVFDGLTHSFSDGKTVFFGDSFAVWGGTSAFIGSETVIENGEEPKLLYGLITMITKDDQFTVYTGTEKAAVMPGSKVAIRVDGYGNAFNYCVEGKIALTSLKDGNQTELNSGEYIAVTVKRGLRILKNTDEKEVKKLGGTFEFANISAITSNEFFSVTEITTDCNEESEIAKVKPCSVYRINITKENYSEDFYLDCAASKARLVVFDKELKKIDDSASSGGALKPKVSLNAECGDSLLFLILSENGEEISLCHHQTETVFTRLFDLAKRLVIPIIIAMILMTAYVLIKKKKNEK